MTLVKITHLKLITVCYTCALIPRSVLIVNYTKQSSVLCKIYRAFLQSSNCQGWYIHNELCNLYTGIRVLNNKASMLRTHVYPLRPWWQLRSPIEILLPFVTCNKP